MSERHAIDIKELARMLDQHAASLAPELLPNGRAEGMFWRTSNVADIPTGKFSLAVNLSGDRIGMWTDFGAARGAPDRSGDMLKLVAVTRFGGDIREACKFARSYLGLDGLDPGRLAVRRAEVSRVQKSADDKAKKTADWMRRKAQQIYLDPRAVPIEGTPAEDYLANRAIDLSVLGRVSRALKFHPAVLCKEANAELPCLIAAVVNGEGHQIATHRTWLQRTARGWMKADLEEPKMCLGKAEGGYIPLHKGASDATLRHVPTGTDIHVSEGIEDGLTVASADPDARVICAIWLDNMHHLPLPNQMGALVLIGQNDKPGSDAERAMGSVIARHQEAGRVVKHPKPPAPFKDFNEMAQAAQASRQSDGAGAASPGGSFGTSAILARAGAA
ncbi:MAG TPA: toprim domain-containing protein [Allosphingosinicella sp.]|jgi:hypothetical protein